LASVVRIVGLTLLVVQGMVLIASAFQMRYQQLWVENGGRKAIGQWLGDHAKPEDTVFLEPLGYIGYFSNLKTYDFPGLSSPEMVKIIKSGERRYRSFIDQLSPTWLVLRPSEIEYYRLGTPDYIPGYRAVRSWDATEQLEAIQFLPGRRWLEFDARFVLFRRDASERSGYPR
jgi:hypothetical protein